MDSPRKLAYWPPTGYHPPGTRPSKTVGGAAGQGEQRDVRQWDDRAWPEIGAVAAQVACPHRARPEAAHKDQHTIMVRSLCGTARLASRPLGSPTHPIHKPKAA